MVVPMGDKMVDFDHVVVLLTIPPEYEFVG